MPPCATRLDKRRRYGQRRRSSIHHLTDIRYVAVYQNGALESHQRPGLENASASESDKYEELFVNPTLLKCATQRGNLDCGGLRGLVVAYGNFLQLVTPIRGGHLSVCFESGSNPLAFIDRLTGLFDED